MPTGYTADLMDGKIVNFNQFALQCARAFGALIEMRDERHDAPIPDEFKPNDCNQKRLEEARQRNVELQNMTVEQVQTACSKDYEESCASRDRYKRDEKLQNDRLEAMEKQVLAWQPPSANHVEMKKFMLDQIRISKHDSSYYDRAAVKKLEPKEWLQAQLEKTQEDIGYHAAEHEKEIERTKGRNLWIKQLRESLKETA